MKLNSALAQRIKSSASRERCTASSAPAAQNSTAKSRSLTASMEFCESRASEFFTEDNEGNEDSLFSSFASVLNFMKPSNFATNSRSIGKVVPAIAPLPSGQTLTREWQSQR